MVRRKRDQKTLHNKSSFQFITETPENSLEQRIKRQKMVNFFIQLVIAIQATES